jgi:tetratricopeptide (TPR) repeat protein
VANQSFRKALEIFNPELTFPWELTPSGYAEVSAKAWWMICLQIMGHMEEAKKLANQHLAYAKDHRDSVTLYHIYTFPPLYNLMAREWGQVQKGLDLYLPIVKEFGDPIFILTAEVYAAIAQAFQGDKAAFEKAVHLVNICFEIGFSAFAVSMCAWIGELYYRFGEFDSCLAWVEKILVHVNKSGFHIQTAELYRVKGLALQALGKSDAMVEQQFHQALDLSRKQSAKTYELRAACELARLWQQQGMGKEAKELLHGVYDWFTGGFDSVDLRDAKALLNHL